VCIKISPTIQINIAYLKQERIENAMAMTYVIEKRGITSFVFASNSTCLDRDVEWVT